MFVKVCNNIFWNLTPMENPAQGARLSCQLVKELKTFACLQGHLRTFPCPWESCCALLQPWVVRYLVWHLHWADINEGRQVRRWSRGRMRNSFSGHKCWVLTLSHFFDINQRLEEDVSKYAPLHRDLLKIQMKWDAEAVELALKWFEENMPFDNNRDKELLMSFSTGFTSIGDDSQCWESSWSRDGNADQAGWTVSDIEHGCQVKVKKPCHHSERFLRSTRRFILTQVQPPDHFCPAGKWQLRQAYSMS